MHFLLSIISWGMKKRNFISKIHMISIWDSDFSISFVHLDVFEINLKAKIPVNLES